MKTLSRVFILPLFLLSTAAHGQLTLGDAESQTALVLEEGGAVSVNFTDNSAKIGYFRKVTGKEWSYGFEFKGKAVDGFSSLFDGETVKPEAEFNLSLGYQPVKHQSAEDAIQGDPDSFVRDWWSVFRIGYRRGEYKLIVEAADFSDQVVDESLDSPSVGVFFNALLRGNFLGGIGLEYGKANNYSRLKKVKAIEVRTIGTDASVTRTIEKEVQGREGTYEEFNKLSANLDLMWVPGSGLFDYQVGIDFFVRFSNGSERGSVFEPGIGLFVLKENAPSQIVAGITAQRDDANGGARLGLTAGLNF